MSNENRVIGMKVDGYKKSNYVTVETAVGIIESINVKRIETILGANNSVRNLYLEGKLNTIINTCADNGSLYNTVSLGARCDAPKELVELFKLVAEAYDSENENLNCLSLGY